MSCSSQVKKQAQCIARMAALDAGYSTRAERYFGSILWRRDFRGEHGRCFDHERNGGPGRSRWRGNDVYVAAEVFNALDAHNVDLRNAHPQTQVGIAADIIATEEVSKRVGSHCHEPATSRGGHWAGAFHRSDSIRHPVAQ